MLPLGRDLTVRVFCHITVLFSGRLHLQSAYNRTQEILLTLDPTSRQEIELTTDSDGTTVHVYLEDKTTQRRMSHIALPGMCRSALDCFEKCLQPSPDQQFSLPSAPLAGYFFIPDSPAKYSSIHKRFTLR